MVPPYKPFPAGVFFSAVDFLPPVKNGKAIGSAIEKIL